MSDTQGQRSQNRDCAPSSRSPPDASSAPFPCRSPRRSSANAAHGGLEPPTLGRSRRAYLHLSQSTASRNLAYTIRPLSTFVAHQEFWTLLLTGCRTSLRAGAITTRTHPDEIIIEIVNDQEYAVRPLPCDARDARMSALITLERPQADPETRRQLRDTLACDGEGGLACAADHAGPEGRSGGRGDLSPGL